MSLPHTLSQKHKCHDFDTLSLASHLCKPSFFQLSHTPKKTKKPWSTEKSACKKRRSSGSLGCVPSSCNNNTEDASVICNLLHVQSLTKSAHLSLLFCCNLLELQMQPPFETIMLCTNARKLNNCMCYYNVPHISLSLSLSLSLSHTHTHTNTHPHTKKKLGGGEWGNFCCMM